MADVDKHISKLIIIIIKFKNNNNKMFVKSYKNLGIINIIKLVLSIIGNTNNFFLKRNLNIKRC